MPAEDALLLLDPVELVAFETCPVVVPLEAGGVVLLPSVPLPFWSVVLPPCPVALPLGPVALPLPTSSSRPSPPSSLLPPCPPSP